MKPLVVFSIIFLTISSSFSQDTEKYKQRSSTAYAENDFKSLEKNAFSVVPFGNGGQVKMIYDRRLRPQAVFTNNKIFMVFNGGASIKANDPEKTYPFVISFDPKTGNLSPSVQLDSKGSSDQHYTPNIWADNNNFLHVLFGCHSTAGTHLISNKQQDIGTGIENWSVAPKIRHSMSYPTIYNIYDNKKLMYFRTGEHRSSWTYLISDDEGNTWNGPENDVVDLNMGGETQEENNKSGIEEWSSYQTCLPSKDGKFLHVAFCYYNDNKKNIPEKFFNPRYNTKVNLDLKYNLYYVKIDLETHEVKNFAGNTVKTPIDLDNANAQCKIWDTEWRGSGVPPDIIIDENDNPAFLHVLSENTPLEFNYYYVRYSNNEWKQSVITASNHEWNSGFLNMDEQGILHAYLIVGDKKEKLKEKSMDRYGGGNIEEWCSLDMGYTWKKTLDITPKSSQFEDWKFNNIQPIKDPKGNSQEGMLLFYGWKDGESRTAKAFLLLRK